ncbi:conserved Plasmodium protein, unknown function [Plasmodium chabaudi adami]|uniref:MYND-type domain-containing protein n=1 Tax=Plasmodium chabaudi adami TaxID=5826 RepID=A0A1D3LEN6_PLACE|nr:conserved Plasmodium protein, unknown function [Plasmodium chabaudi adami]
MTKWKPTLSMDAENGYKAYLKSLENNEDDLFSLLKNRNTSKSQIIKKKIASINHLMCSFLKNDNEIFNNYKPCDLDDQNEQDENNASASMHEDKHGKSKNNPVGACKFKKLASHEINFNRLKKKEINENMKINDKYNDIMLLSNKNFGSENIHLKKILNTCNEVYNNLKFYKAENHDIYKFRPNDVDTDITRIKDDIDTLKNDNYLTNTLNCSEENALKFIQNKCKKIVQCLNVNCDLVDISEVVGVLNIITTPEFDERLDKYEYLKLFLNKYHYVYPYEDIKGLRSIRKYVKKNFIDTGKFYINEKDISHMYLKTDLDQIIKNDNFINNMLNLHIDTGKFWIQILHNVWIPLIIEIFNSINTPFFSYLMNYDNEVTILDQYTFSGKNAKFYKFSQHIFSGILFSGVPSIYRLLMRLHTYKYIEVRINMILEESYNNIYNGVASSSLTYNINILRSLFPFFKEFKNIDMEQIVENFFTSEFYNITISSLKKSNIQKVIVSQKYITFINSFFLMITEFLYGVLNKSILEQINENKINLMSLLEDIFYENMNILIGRDILLFIADLLCLYKLSCVYLKKRHCNAIINITNIIINLYYHNQDMLINTNTWKQVYTIAIKVNHFVKCALQGTQTVNDNIVLQELSIINRYYFNDIKHDQNSIGEFYFLKNINYGIYCWNSICNKYTNVRHFEYNKNDFQYCQGCYIATYCSEQCKITHLLYSHHKVCVYFKTIPSFLKFNILEMENNYNCAGMKYLNIFRHVDTFNRKNEEYQIIY